MIGWSYDAAGNLLSDGTTTRSYDALSRMVAQAGTSYTYNGDGVLVSAGTTTYAQDLAAPLSQVLSDGTANYVYGHDRLRALGGPWYVGDALGSVRQTLDDAGGVLGSVQYDPWGVPTAGTPQPFGFTGELHRAGQVYLRARWYAPGQGRFVSEDPFAGFPEMPYSLHAYQYAYSDPVRWTDPSGEVVPDGPDIGGDTDCFDAQSPAYSTPACRYERMEGIKLPLFLARPCATALDWFTDPPSKPRDIGFVEGYALVGQHFIGGIGGGYERVYNLYDFEVAEFQYGIPLTSLSTDPGVSVIAYVGFVTGWANFEEGGVDNYAGTAASFDVSAGPGIVPIVGSLEVFTSSGRRMWGGTAGLGIGHSMLPVGVAASGMVSWRVGEKTMFHTQGFRKQNVDDAIDFYNYVGSGPPTWMDLIQVFSGGQPWLPFMYYHTMRGIIMRNGVAWEHMQLR